MSHLRSVLILPALWLTAPVLMSCDSADEQNDPGTIEEETTLIWQSPPQARIAVGDLLAVAFTVETRGNVDRTAIRVCAADEDNCGLGPEGTYVEFPTTATEDDFQAAFMLDLGDWWVVAHAQVDQRGHVSEPILVTVDPD